MSKEILRYEAERIKEDAEYSSKGHFESSKFWRYSNYFLMCVSIFTLITSLVFTFSDFHKLATGIIASISSFITILLIFLNPQEKYLSHYSSGNKFLKLRNKTNIFLNLDINTIDDIQTLQTKLKKLAKKRDLLNEISLPISSIGYKSAKMLIEVEKTTEYKVEKDEK